MSKQPEYELIAQLGDASPFDFGGYFIYRDKTGVYDDVGEILFREDEEDENENSRYLVYRFDLERCTWDGKLGVLSDNKYHPDHPAWFATPESKKSERPQDTTYLSNMAKCFGVKLKDLRMQFCSDNPVVRAQAYRMVGEYHGFDNLDHYPLELSYQEVVERYPSVTP